jgi:death-on-curing protein
MRYVTIEEVVKINEDILDTESAIIRDIGLLASAVDRPAQVVFGADAYPTLYDKAAALMESICCNHAFIQGNKRTAVVAVIHFLNWNGYDLQAEQMELVDVTLDVVEHRIDREKLAEWIEMHTGPLDFSAGEDQAD